MGERVFSEQKVKFSHKFQELLDEYNRIIIVGANNVGSNHMQKIRVALRGKGVVMMGKNTMIHRVLRLNTKKQSGYESLIGEVKGNVGFVFTKAELSEVRQILLSNKVLAAAKAGAIAPNDVVVPAGPTGLEPTQTAFLQALDIASKINKGQIEIINDVHLIKKGERVGSSEATLLQKLNIKPFLYGLTVVSIYDDGFILTPEVLDISDNDILASFRQGVTNVACVSLATNTPTIASLPHVLAKGYSDVLSVALETDTNIKQVQRIKYLLENPEAQAAAVSAAPAPTATTAAPKATAKAPEPEPEPEEEEVGMGGLFGDDF